MAAPDVQVTITWVGDLVKGQIVIDKTIKMNFDISPISQIDETVGKYLDIVTEIIKSFKLK